MWAGSGIYGACVLYSNPTHIIHLYSLLPAPSSLQHDASVAFLSGARHATKVDCLQLMPVVSVICALIDNFAAVTCSLLAVSVLMLESSRRNSV